MKTGIKHVLFSIIAASMFACMSAHATLIQFDMVGGVARSSGGVIAPHYPETIKLSMTIDTGYYTPTYTLGDRGTGFGEQLLSLQSDLLLSNFSFTANGSNLLSFDSSVSGALRATQFNLGPGDGYMDGVLDFSDGSSTIYFPTAAIFKPITAQQFQASSDPVADLLLSLDRQRNLQPNNIYGDWGSFSIDIDSLSVHVVPEPESPALFCIGLAGVLSFRVRCVIRRKPVGRMATSSTFP